MPDIEILSSWSDFITSRFCSHCTTSNEDCYMGANPPIAGECKCWELFSELFEEFVKMREIENAWENDEANEDKFEAEYIKCQEKCSSLYNRCDRAIANLEDAYYPY